MRRGGPPAINHPWRQYPTRRRGGRRKPPGTTRDDQVAEAMANGDRLEGDKVRHATSADIAKRLGMAETHVRSVQARIRKQLGWQAR